MLKFRQVFFPSSFLSNIVIHISLNNACYMPRQFHAIDLNILEISDEEYELSHDAVPSTISTYWVFLC
jgi:hypothetical protein